MSFEFSAYEIFEMAEQMERNGQQFYNAAAAAVQGEEHKKLLLELAGMEVDHEKIFKAMRTELTQKQKQTNVFDPEGDAALYLKALVDTRVFFQKEMALFQLLLADREDDAETLLAWCLEQDFARVVVKRPVKAPELGGSRLSHAIRGRTVRYDVYVRRALG